MENFKPVLEELERRGKDPNSKKVNRAVSDMIKLLRAMDAKNVAPAAINEQLIELKAVLNDAINHKKLNRIYHDIVGRMRREHKLVTPAYYQGLWMLLGMSAFGIPLGTVIFALTDNAAFISLGLPMGLPFGLVIGSIMDKKAKEEGRVLDMA